MLKINPGMALGGGMGVGGEGAGTHNIVWSVFPCPASPPSPPIALLVLPKPQRTLGQREPP